MCGLAGFFSASGFGSVDAETVTRSMSSQLIHRGPDDAGVWLDAEAGIALGHQRLAILELSAAGKQPMAAASGRYMLAFNGEIYNHLQMRDELAHAGSTPAWRGHSDTETLLAAFDHWGVAATLERCVGMFAIALWDRAERRLTLARDRLGEKPLFYGWQGGHLLFGSQLSALRAHPAFGASVDRSALADYLHCGYITSPASIYTDIFKLVPGEFVQFDTATATGTVPQSVKYWSLDDVARDGMARPFSGSDIEAVDELDRRLSQAVQLQSIADVPVGAFLSGGFDSTTIVALMQRHASRPVKSFTIGFDEATHNEAVHAKRVAQHLGTEHTELYVTPREATDVIPSLPQVYDEPFGDSSAVPTILVSRLAREQVTVSLSGDGGDELFGGYTRYFRTREIWDQSRRLPAPLRQTVGVGLNTLSALMPTSHLGRRIKRRADLLRSRNISMCFQNHVRQRNDVHKLVLGSEPIAWQGRLLESALKCGDQEEAMMMMDALGYLPDDILTKVDRAAMAVSLETRVPMLDHRVVEFAWQLPQHMKIRDGQGKWLLRKLLGRYVPDSMMDRPKMGFGVPVGQWIREPLRDWAESLLAPQTLKEQGFLNPKYVQQEWAHHLATPSSSGDKIWQILMFQAWLAHTGSA